MSGWIDDLAAKLPPELVTWARTQPDLATAWTSCPQVDWLIELGAALPLDDTSRRALVVAAASIDVYDPKFLRLKPSRLRIAEAWALHQDADSFDLLGTMRFEDYQNGIVVALPFAVGAMLVLQYHFHVPHSTLSAIRLGNLVAMPGYGLVWGFLRRRLTARTLRRYRYEQAADDVFAPICSTVRRLPESLRSRLLARFRRNWARIADFPTPRLSVS